MDRLACIVFRVCAIAALVYCAVIVYGPLVAGWIS